MNMNTAATLSGALSSRGAVPKVLLRHYHALRSQLASGCSPVSSWAAAASVTSAHHPHDRNRIRTHRPLLASFPLQRPRPPTIAAVRHLFIQTDTTPNPESLKFIPNGRLVLGHRTESVDSADPHAADDDDDDDGASATTSVYITRKDHDLLARSPLAKVVFAVDPGVKSVHLCHDFLTVTKYAEAHWAHLQTPIFGALMDFYATDEPVFRDVPEITDTTILDDDDEVVAMIKELLETRIRPAVQEDGGDIRYVGFDEGTGIVTVQLAGSCVGCPSSSVTLKNGVENMLMHYIPEVTNVVSLEEEEDDGGYAGAVERDGGAGVVVEQSKSAEEQQKMQTYKDKLAAAGIPFSD